MHYSPDMGTLTWQLMRRLAVLSRAQELVDLQQEAMGQVTRYDVQTAGTE